jgi:transcriptional regulator with XRE-family HTH domain
MSSVDDYNIGKATVRLWKRGERVPDLEDLLRLVDATQRPLDPELRTRIFGGSLDPPEKDELAAG